MMYKACGGSSTTMIKNKPKAPPPPAKSCFLNISITSKKSKAFSESTPKVRIKIPKLLVKMTTVKKKKKKKYHSNNGDQHKLTIRHKKIIFPTKIASFFPNVISSKKPSSSCYPVRKKDYSRNKNNGKECKSRRVLVIEDKSNKMCMKTAVEESAPVTSKISLKTCERPRFSTSLKIGCLKEEKTTKRTGLIISFKLYPRMKFSFKSMLNRRTGLKFSGGKRNAPRCKGNSNDHNSTVRDMKAKERKHGSGEDEDEGSDCQLELCKKRILMGERCRPMNFGGILQ